MHSIFFLLLGLAFRTILFKSAAFFNLIVLLLKVLIPFRQSLQQERLESFGKKSEQFLCREPCKISNTAKDVAVCPIKSAEAHPAQT